MDVLEYVCAENEKDHQHLVGTTSDAKPAVVIVAPEVLAQYVTYLRAETGTLGSSAMN